MAAVGQKLAGRSLSNTGGYRNVSITSRAMWLISSIGEIGIRKRSQLRNLRSRDTSKVINNYVNVSYVNIKSLHRLYFIRSCGEMNVGGRRFLPVSTAVRTPAPVDRGGFPLLFPSIQIQ